jgi:hypothetical protein
MEVHALLMQHSITTAADTALQAADQAARDGIMDAQHRLSAAKALAAQAAAEKRKQVRLAAAPPVAHLPQGLFH